MAVHVLGAALQGIEAVPVHVEVDLLRRLPRVCIVGLATNAVHESAERIRSALVSSGAEFPRQRVVVNLAPADVRKDGTAFDLPIALGVLAADGQLDPERLDHVLALGELGLDGGLRPVRGAPSLAHLARQTGRVLILPPGSAEQAAVVPDVEVRVATTLRSVLDHLHGRAELPRATAPQREVATHAVCLAEVRGQATARRALEIAAAGAHHLLLVGPPGCGKSMLARRLPTIVPSMTLDEALEATRIHAAAGLLDEQRPILRERPFRAPHHSVSVAGMIGDRRLRPGEVSLAHHGVLFLDEAAEFTRSALEVLRTPLEEGAVRLVRAEGTIEYPASLTLVMASNPCPCGRRSSTEICRCTDTEVHRYRRRLSGPILDRLDLHVELQPVPAYVVHGPPGESSADVRRRVTAARDFRGRRGQHALNGALSPAEVDQFAQATREARDVLERAADLHGLSARASVRTTRVARTIADLAASERIEEPHMAEALAFRPIQGFTN